MTEAMCHCTNGKAAPNGGRCDCIEARVHACELQATFDLRWKADMRAIKRWQAAHPGRELVWPDHVDLVIWLDEQLAASLPSAEVLAKALFAAGCSGIDPDADAEDVLRYLSDPQAAEDVWNDAALAAAPATGAER